MQAAEVVHVHCRPGIGNRGLGDGPAHRHTGGVHRDIELPIGIHRYRYERGHVLLDRSVAAQGETASQPGEFLQRGFAARAHDEPGTFLGKAAGNRPAAATGCRSAEDDGHFSFEYAHVVLPSWSVTT